MLYVVYRRNLGYEDVLEALSAKGISIRVASPKLVMEEVHVYNVCTRMSALGISKTLIVTKALSTLPCVTSHQCSLLWLHNFASNIYFCWANSDAY